MLDRLQGKNYVWRDVYIVVVTSGHQHPVFTNDATMEQGSSLHQCTGDSDSDSDGNSNSKKCNDAFPPSTPGSQPNALVPAITTTTTSSSSSYSFFAWPFKTSWWTLNASSNSSCSSFWWLALRPVATLALGFRPAYMTCRR